MLASELVTGRSYAQRAEPRNRESPLRKVVFVGPARSGKARIRHAEGELDGLEEWAPSRTLVCRWGERAAFLRDETRLAAIKEATDRHYDSVVEDAISDVLTATGEEGGFSNIWSLDPDKARRLWDRAGLDGEPDDHPLAFIDRHGTLHLPYETTLRFAQAFAAAEPESVILYIQEWEDRLRAEGYEPGNRHSHDFLRTMRPAHALARQWAGRAEVTMLREENDRLRRLVHQAISALTQAGNESAARRIERGLRGQ